MTGPGVRRQRFWCSNDKAYALTRHGTAHATRIVTTGGWRMTGILCHNREFSVTTNLYSDKKKKKTTRIWGVIVILVFIFFFYCTLDFFFFIGVDSQ